MEFLFCMVKKQSGNKKGKVIRKNPWIKRSQDCRYQFHEEIVRKYKRAYKLEEKNSW